jgi:hypothetical protein
MNNSLVAEYETSESSSEEGRHHESSPKRRVIGNWIKIGVFSGSDEAEKFIKDKKIWGFHYKNKTEEGIKKYFRCNQVKLRGQQCSAKIYLQYDSTSHEVHLFKTKSEHNHDSIETKGVLGIDPSLKLEIQKLFDLKLKPKAILIELSKNSDIRKLPSKRQLDNYLHQLRESKYGPSQISVGELEAWLLKNSVIPEDLHIPFVEQYELETEEEESIFRFFITSRYLMSICANSYKIHADATYKLLWQGFPVLIVGTTDMDKHFHPFGLSVCTNEKKEDFKFLFRALVATSKKLFEKKFEPNVLICDAAKSIQNAFIEIFGTDKLIIMCWAHMRKNVQKRVERDVEKKNRSLILSDINTLQLSSSPEIFEKAVELFKKKWNTEQAFLNYFEREWLSDNSNWYEGVMKHVPSTNNALEAFNKVIKDTHTLRERLSLNHFLSVALESVQQWSNDYKTELKKFSKIPTITLSLWTSAYQWTKKNKPVLIVSQQESQISYKIPAGDSTEEPGELNDICAENWVEFEEFKNKAFSSWITTMSTSPDEWIKGNCNCPAFFKNMICKHIIGIAIRLKYVKPPPEARNISIQGKRKRGRPSKAKKALIVQ